MEGIMSAHKDTEKLLSRFRQQMRQSQKSFSSGITK